MMEYVVILAGSKNVFLMDAKFADCLSVHVLYLEKY